jgi:hypothetical protein
MDHRLIPDPLIGGHKWTLPPAPQTNVWRRPLSQSELAPESQLHSKPDHLLYRSWPRYNPPRWDDLTAAQSEEHCAIYFRANSTATPTGRPEDRIAALEHKFPKSEVVSAGEGNSDHVARAGQAQKGLSKARHDGLRAVS